MVIWEQGGWILIPCDGRLCGDVAPGGSGGFKCGVLGKYLLLSKFLLLGIPGSIYIIIIIVLNGNSVMLLVLVVQVVVWVVSRWDSKIHTTVTKSTR